MHRAPEYVLSHFGDMDSLGRCCKSRRCNRCLELEDETVNDSLVPKCGSECWQQQQPYRQDLAFAMKSDAEAQGKLLVIISERLNETVQLNEACKLPPRLACFEGNRPLLSPADYVRRIAKYSGTSDCCFLVGLVYLDRLKHCEPALRLTPTSLQRLLLVAVMLATKFLEDRGPQNKWWAEIGGLGVRELNALELQFLFRIGFRLGLHREEYDLYARRLLASSPAPTPTPTTPSNDWTSPAAAPAEACAAARWVRWPAQATDPCDGGLVGPAAALQEQPSAAAPAPAGPPAPVLLGRAVAAAEQPIYYV